MEGVTSSYKISFQIIHQTESISEFLKLNLKETYEEFYIEKSEEEIEKLLLIKYSTKLNLNKYLTGFLIIIEGIETNNFEAFHETFIKDINENGGVISIIKLSDETRFIQYIDLYKEIALLEMQLREILTYIFYKEYPDTPFRVLLDYPIKPLKDIPIEEEFKNRMENEFFYLIFSDYINLEKPKEISNIKDISSILESSDSFESFKDKITKRGISNERHKDFLASIKSNLLTIEIVRNSVAHNRTISERAFGHYEVARNKLNESFFEFWDNISIDEPQFEDSQENSSKTGISPNTKTSVKRQSIRTNYSKNKSKKKNKLKNKSKHKGRR